MTTDLALYNVDAEMSVLGGLLFDGNAFAKIKDILEPQAFYLEAHQRIYRAIAEVGTQIDAISVIDRLQTKGQLEAVGGKGKIASLLSSCADTVNLDNHAKIIRDWWQRRQLLKAGQDLARAASDPNASVDEQIKAVSQVKSQKWQCVDKGSLIRDRITNILNSSLSEVERKSGLLTLAQEIKRPLKEIEQLYELHQLEGEVDERRIETISELDKMIGAAEASLDIHRILPATMSQPLSHLASWLNLKPEVYTTVLLTAVSALQKVGTKLVISESIDFEVTPNLFTALIAESSQKKSPILKSIVYKPLRSLQAEAREEYKKALTQYQVDIDRWNSTKAEDRSLEFPSGKPKEPRAKVYYMSGASGEGLVYQMQAHPKQGILYTQDELAGILKSANMYRQGKGSDEEDLLSLYDGSGMTIVRASGVKADLDATNLGVLGSIQPSVLQSFMKDCSDSNGKWARFIFVQQPLAASSIPDGGGHDLNSLLVDLYKKVDNLPPMEYRLSKEAFDYYRPIYQQLEIRRVNDPHSGMRSVWGKSEGRIGKLAINLHVIHELSRGVMPSREIPKARIVEAVELANFYIQQVKALHVQFASSFSIAPNLAKVVDLSKRKGWIKTRDVQQQFDSKMRPQPDAIRSWFRELEAMGRGTIRGEGIKVEFSARHLSGGILPPENASKSGDSVEQSGEDNSTPKTHSLQVVEDDSSHIVEIVEQTEKINLEVGDEVILEDGSEGVVSFTYQSGEEACIDLKSEKSSVLYPIAKLTKKELRYG